MGWYRCTSGTGSAWQPYTYADDIWGALNAPLVNISGNYSQYENANKTSSMISFICTAASGYEGICLTFPRDYNIVSGTTYNLTFTLTIPDGITINTSYRWGCKWSSTELTSFNVAPTVSFTRTAGITENITLQFTADSSNYLAILLSALTGGSGRFNLTNIQIEEAT